MKLILNFGFGSPKLNLSVELAGFFVAVSTTYPLLATSYLP